MYVTDTFDDVWEVVSMNGSTAPNMSINTQNLTTAPVPVLLKNRETGKTHHGLFTVDRPGMISIWVHHGNLFVDDTALVRYILDS